MFDAMGRRLHARSAVMLLTLDTQLPRILRGWLIIAALACTIRFLIAPVSLAEAGVRSFAPYVLLTLAPVASILLALRWFADADGQPQPSTRLAVVGRWTAVCAAKARAHPLYGTSGIMVSVLIGMLLNVPLRAAEFLAAMPPIPQVAPQWLSTMQIAMTFDVVVFTSLYAIAFVAALKRLPLFPRLLAAIWLCDIAMQLVIGHAVASSAHLPGPVADALQALLYGNVQKVLISVGLWLPYLLLSTRVNVTYRHRVPA